MATRKARYRIQAVAEMTGVPAATLRAWERRYGLPSPARTASAYRLYSDDDIAMVARVRDLCAQGMAPAEAAHVVLNAQRDLSLPRRDLDAFAAATERLFEAIAAYDDVALEREARATLVLGSASQICSGVIIPLMRRVGETWHAGELSIAQEHLASETLGGLARDLLRLVQPGEGARRALLACFPDEIHTLPLFAAGIYLAQLGYRISVLGARTPASELGRAVVELDPSVVGLSSTTRLPAAQFEAHLRAYAAACGKRPLVVGGPGAAEHATVIKSVGAVLAPADLSQLGSLLAQKR